MSKIPCEMIQDLLPSYIDELTSEVTNREVESHVSECGQCKKVLDEMRASVLEPTEKEEKEIDFLKKTKRRHRKNIIICAAVVWAIAVLVFCARAYFGGQYVNAEYLAYHLDVSGQELSVGVNTASKQGIQKIEINESEGVVEISVRCVPKSFFYGTASKEQYTASQNIRQVWIGDRIVWANGEEISPLTSSLYAVYNPYVGNMPSNGAIVRALNMTAYTGNFKNELQTKEEPYAWKMIFENEFSSSRQEAFEERLQTYAYILLAQIGNLDEVIYEYRMDGETKTLSVRSRDASEFLGEDIKDAGTDINLLELLVKKTELSNVVIGGTVVESNSQVEFSNRGQVKNVLGFTVVNFAEDEVYGIQLQVDCKKASGNQGMTSADNSPLQNGENIDFQLIPEDFAKEIKDGTKAVIRLRVVDEAGSVHEVQGEIYADLYWGNCYRLNLSGNAEDGYFLGM